MIKHHIGIIILLLGLVLIIGCSSGDDTIIGITGVGWYLENIDYSYWTSGYNDATLFIDFELKYEGDPITYLDIDSVLVSSGAAQYNISIDESDLDMDNHIIRLFRLNTAGHTIDIGNYDFEVKLTNGLSATYQFSVPAPGSTSTNGAAFAFNELYSGTVSSIYTPMLKKVIPVSQTKNASSVDITFKTDDPLFYSGWVQFYDSDNYSVGYSEDFRNYADNTIQPLINNGSVIYNDNTENDLVIQYDEITYFTGGTFSDISSYIIFASDGFQYAATNLSFDCLSSSVRTSF